MPSCLQEVNTVTLSEMKKRNYCWKLLLYKIALNHARLCLTYQSRPLKNQIGGFCHGGNVMFRVNSDGKNYLAIYWYLTHFFAENHVISHVIIFLTEANELIQSLGGCFERFHKIVW